MNYAYILPRKRWYTQQRSIRRATAALILAGGVLLGGALWPRAEAADSEPEQVGFLLITGQRAETDAPPHPALRATFPSEGKVLERVLTLRGVDPALCAGIEAPEIEEKSEPVEVPVEAAPEVVLSDEDVDLLARITMAEAESESELGKRLVIDTVLNRMEDSRFPDTVSGVVYQPHQFTPVENGRLSRCYVQDEIRDLVLEECMTRTNRECLYFQRGSSCPWGTLVLHEGGHYFFM